MKISLILPDPSMPRTVYYDQFCRLVTQNSRYVPDPAAADVVFPAEDTAVETNCPRYGNAPSAYIRGQMDLQAVMNYLSRLAATPLSGQVCIPSFHPAIRLTQALAQRPGYIIADLNLHRWERAQNPRSVSMLALPIISSRNPPGNKTILASFRGAASHPCRFALQKIHDGTTIICQLIDPANHKNLIDATTGASDPLYSQLLEQSIFAFVPRGDCMFSYRLAEVLSFGCIPVILSDGWVLPFDRSLPWDSFSLHFPEHEIPMLPAVLRAFPPARIQQMLTQARHIYQNRLSSLEAVLESLLQELELLVAPSGE